jgi:23S rRNA (adenine-N6)-dimethyltransferase
VAQPRREPVGQHLLVDDGVVRRVLRRVRVRPGELIVDVGAGTGALTLPLAAAGAHVLAIERDPRLCRVLQAAIEREGLGSRVQVRRADLRAVRWPRQPYRVVANPPFALTTVLLSRLLDDPGRGPVRADLLLQRDAARERAATPATTLRTAAWSPWWRFSLGEDVPRSAFRPPPSVDAAWLTVERRDPPLLPLDLAPRYPDLLAPAWPGRLPAGVRRPTRAPDRPAAARRRR